MGIPGLWKEIQQYGIDVSVPRLHEALAAGRSTSKQVKIGIDISLWIAHASSLSVEFPDRVERIIFYRLCRLLQLPNLQPIFVFDGQHRPDLKRGKLLSKAARDECKPHRHDDRIKKLIDAFGFSYTQAPGEAEAELGSLHSAGQIDAVMSDDADCFAFGATVVVRNWSSTLSGSKARSAHVHKAQVGSPLSSSGSSGAGSSEEEVFDRRSLDLETLRKHENLTAVYRMKYVNDGFDRDGCILVAMLSGGDYDTNGVQRCGEKTALAMAKAGFARRLIKGARTYLSVTQELNRYDPSSPPPQRKAGWTEFLHAWREDVADELKSNRSGFMRTKQAKLAQSDMVRAFLSSDTSVRQLASYIWPVVTDIAQVKIAEQNAPDVKRIAALTSAFFGWEEERTNVSMRNSVWLGCLCQHLHGRRIEAFDHVEENRRGILVLRQRIHAKTGHLQEVYVAFGVLGLAADAEAGISMAKLDDDLQYIRRARTPVTSTTPSSSQARARTLTPSPRKNKKPQDVRRPMREWIALALVEKSEEGQQALRTFRKSEQQKAEQKARKENNNSPSKNQRTLNDFFTKTVAKPLMTLAVRDAKLSPSKRIAHSSPRSSAERIVDLSTSRKIARPLSPSPTKVKIGQPSPGHITISDDEDDSDGGGDESNDQPIFVRASRAVNDDVL